jgi:hypothetical protein
MQIQTTFHLNFELRGGPSGICLVGKFTECGQRQGAAASRCENSNQRAVSENVREILDRPNKKLASF